MQIKLGASFSPILVLKNKKTIKKIYRKKTFSKYKTDLLNIEKNKGFLINESERVNNV